MWSILTTLGFAYEKITGNKSRIKAGETSNSEKEPFGYCKLQRDFFHELSRDTLRLTNILPRQNGPFPMERHVDIPSCYVRLPNRYHQYNGCSSGGMT